VRSFRTLIKALVERTSGRHVLPRLPHAAYEIAHLRKLFAHLEVDCVFDVGANRGQYARMLRHGVGFAGPIISFEPLPDLVEEMRAAGSGDAAWHVEALALDREAGPASFNVMRGNQFSSLRAPEANLPDAVVGLNRVVRQVDVMRATLREELPRWRDRLGFKRPFLKLDTQGNDLAVVEGAGDAIAHFVGLQSELAFRSLYAGSASAFEAISAYRALGFELSALVPNNAGHFPLLVEMDCIMFRTRG
jgi:FkbM family methyltransferase